MTNAMLSQVIQIVIMVVAFIPALVLHEVAHGYAAYKLGDPTAKNAGRLSLNPLRHVDPFGTVILPGCLIAMSVLGGGGGMLFGYAKPVPYNPRYFKDIRKGELIVGLVGPADQPRIEPRGRRHCLGRDLPLPDARSSSGPRVLHLVLRDLLLHHQPLSRVLQPHPDSTT